MGFPGKELVQNPMLDLYSDIEIEADPGDIRPWISQFDIIGAIGISTRGGINLSRITSDQQSYPLEV